MKKISLLVLLCWLGCALVGAVGCGEDAEEPEGGCAGDAACGEGMRCVEGACVADERCEAGATRCEAGALVRCGADGEESRERCPEDTACAGEDGAASCEAVICVAGSRRCLNQRQYSICDASGTAREDLDCPEGMSCREGACVETPCEAFEIGCLSESAAYTCDGAGNLTELPCGEGERCLNSVCTVQACLPDSITCEGDVLVQCGADGMSQTRTECATVETCQGAPNGCGCRDGACVEL